MRWEDPRVHTSFTHHAHGPSQAQVAEVAAVSAHFDRNAEELADLAATGVTIAGVRTIHLQLKLKSTKSYAHLQTSMQYTKNLRKAIDLFNDLREELSAAEQIRVDEFEKLKKDDAESVQGLEVARLTEMIRYRHENGWA